MSHLYKKSLIEIFELYSVDNNHLSEKTLRKMRDYIKLYGYEIMDLTFEEVNKKKLSQILELNLSNKKLNAYIQILLQYVKTKI
jgi:hypothetical protein